MVRASSTIRQSLLARTISSASSSALVLVIQENMPSRAVHFAPLRLGLPRTSRYGLRASICGWGRTHNAAAWIGPTESRRSTLAAMIVTASVRLACLAERGMLTRRYAFMVRNDLQIPRRVGVD